MELWLNGAPLGLETQNPTVDANGHNTVLLGITRFEKAHAGPNPAREIEETGKSLDSGRDKG